MFGSGAAIGMVNTNLSRQLILLLLKWAHTGSTVVAAGTIRPRAADRPAAAGSSVTSGIAPSAFVSL